MDLSNWRRRAATVRDTPLETVLVAWGAVRDRQDKKKWHTDRGPISVTGPRFYNWHSGTGGGGAIDLVMHLAGTNCQRAITWLELTSASEMISASALPSPPARTNAPPHSCAGQLRLPKPYPAMLHRIRQYLTVRRSLAAEQLEPLIESGWLYADARANAVFLLVAGKAQRPVGAELRGTGQRRWRGMAPGTDKNAGYFWVGPVGSKQIILCESAIDALSCQVMHPDHICISTSGARPAPHWLPSLVARKFEIHCGFDADGPGDTAAHRLIGYHPSIRRLRPPVGDWNTTLVEGKSNN